MWSSGFRRGGICAVLGSLLLFTSAADAARERGEAEPTLEYGARVYQERCVLCHGREGYGDGMLPVSMKEYPAANLHKNRFGRELDDLRMSIIYGGSLGTMSSEMPPWGDELTYTQVESVAMFTKLLIDQPKKAVALMEQAEAEQEPSYRLGRAIFKNYCSLCHGENGEGDGKMAKIIKDPPPFNLTLSRAPDDYLMQIISKGGAAMGRSPRMPPWGEQFSESERRSVIMYIKTLRR